MQNTFQGFCPDIFQLQPCNFDYAVTSTSNFSTKTSIQQHEQALINDPRAFNGPSTSFLIAEQPPNDKQTSLQRLAIHSSTFYKESQEIPRYDDVGDIYPPVESPYESLVTAVDQSSYGSLVYDVDHTPYGSLASDVYESPYGSLVSDINQLSYGSPEYDVDQTPYGSLISHVDQSPCGSLVSNVYESPYGSHASDVNQSSYGSLVAHVDQSPYGSLVSHVDQSACGSIVSDIDQSPLSKEQTQDLSSIPSLTTTCSNDYSQTDLSPGCDISTLSPDTSGSCSLPTNYTSTTAGEKPGSSDGKKNKRTKYSVEQTNRLERLFIENQYPDQDAVEKIAIDIGVAEGRIRIWFQNKRSRWRRQTSTTKYHPLSHMASIPNDIVGLTPGRDIHHHNARSTKNHGSSSDYGFNYSVPESDLQLQRAIVNLIYSSDQRLSPYHTDEQGSHLGMSPYHADERPSHTLTSPYHAVTSLYERIAKSSYSYSPLC